MERLIISTKAGAGLHWFVVFQMYNIVEVFDSAGTSEMFLKDVLHQFKGSCVCNVTRLQPKDSNKCGEFALFFVLNRVYNKDLDFSDLLNSLFSQDVVKNEEEVLDFLYEVKQP